MDFKEQLLHFDAFLLEKTHAYFPLPSLLNEAVHYSLLSEGKRIRPLLCLGFSQAFKGDQKIAIRLAMAVEMIHAYSLIHDDLPAMDNDDFRRGVPTNHKVFGEAQAILAGDSLLNMAPEILIKELRAQKIDPNKVLDIVTLLLEASGHAGMVKGQSLDMDFGQKDLSLIDKASLENILISIHKLKTGAIITWSCVAGLYSLADDSQIQRNLCMVKSVGQRIGLLFQVIDDILDATSTLEKLGKTPGKDQVSAKLTYTNLYGIDGATQMAKSLIQEIYQDLEDLKILDEGKIILEIMKSLEDKLPH